MAEFRYTLIRIACESFGGNARGETVQAALVPEGRPLSSISSEWVEPLPFHHGDDLFHHPYGVVLPHEHRPERFDSLDVDLSADAFAHRMVGRVVFHVGKPRVCLGLIGMYPRPGFGDGVRESVQGLFVGGPL